MTLEHKLHGIRLRTFRGRRKGGHVQVKKSGKQTRKQRILKQRSSLHLEAVSRSSAFTSCGSFRLGSFQDPEELIHQTTNQQHPNLPALSAQHHQSWNTEQFGLTVTRLARPLVAWAENPINSQPSDTRSLFQLWQHSIYVCCFSSDIYYEDGQFWSEWIDTKVSMLSIHGHQSVHVPTSFQVRSFKPFAKQRIKWLHSTL